MGCWFSGLRKSWREWDSSWPNSIRRVRMVMPCSRAWAERMSSRVIIGAVQDQERRTLPSRAQPGRTKAPVPAQATGNGRASDLQYHRHDQRALLSLPGNIALQIRANLLLDHAVVCFFLFAGVRQGVFDDALCSVQQTVFSGIEAASYDLRRRFHAAGKLVDGDDGQHNAVFAQVPPVFNNQILNHIRSRAGIDVVED